MCYHELFSIIILHNAIYHLSTRFNFVILIMKLNNVCAVLDIFYKYCECHNPTNA